MSFKNKFASLGAPRKIWAISALEGDLAVLARIHAALYEAAAPGDRIIYTGNYLAHDGASTNNLPLDEILHFRRAFLARRGMQLGDIVYLRGAQEELWHRLLQLQLALAPQQTLSWIMEHYPEMNFALQGYGSSFNDIAVCQREGILSLTRWSSSLKESIRHHPGHEAFFSALRRAAFTDTQADNGNILFVHAGLDPQQPLTDQGDNLFWGTSGFKKMQAPYHPFSRVIRGFDPDHEGIKIGPMTVSLGGTQPLCAEMSPQGDVLGVLAS